MNPSTLITDHPYQRHIYQFWCRCGNRMEAHLYHTRLAFHIGYQQHICYANYYGFIIQPSHNHFHAVINLRQP